MKKTRIPKYPFSIKNIGKYNKSMATKQKIYANKVSKIVGKRILKNLLLRQKELKTQIKRFRKKMR